MKIKKPQTLSLMIAAMLLFLLFMPTISSNDDQNFSKDLFDFGDAPEGPGAIAYPSTATMGAFPTCISCGPSAWIQHNNFGAYFGPTVDLELDGNGGLCPTGSFPPYDQDECFMDADAGLLVPDSYTIDSSLNVIPCPTGMGMPLGVIGQTVTWGIEIDIDVTNFMPSATTGYVNVLMDWNQNGMWGDPGEHVLINHPVPNPFSGPLSALAPPPFIVGPNPGYVWTRFSITEMPVTPGWNGEGIFEDGETEDYLLKIDSINNPPTASFTYSPPSPTDLDLISFTDTSTDTDGTLVNWSWDFGDGDTSYQQNPTHQYADDDTYTVRLTVKDDEDATDTTTKTLTVTNVAPTADAGGPYNAAIGESITLDGSTSIDSDGTIVLYQWDLDFDGAYDDATGTTTTHSWSSGGTYSIGLKVTDDDGDTDTDTTTVTVGAQNRPPQTPSITGPREGKYGTEYTYNFTATDPDADDVSFTIDWGDDGTETTITVSSGETLQVSHTWEKEDREGQTIDTAYLLKAKAVDSHDAESDWGSLEVNMPLSIPNRLALLIDHLINWLCRIIPAFANLIYLPNL